MTSDTVLPIANDHPLHANDSNLICSALDLGGMQRVDVRTLHLVSALNRREGFEFSECAPATGVLQSRERYGVYRFFIYLDGFQTHSGNSASCDGIYLQPLSIPPNARNDSSSARVLAIVPPGVSINEVMKPITKDITEGMTNGHPIIDAEGKKRRIFLDLVGILGDTTGINSLLDVAGHMGIASCHRCSFDKRESSELHNPFLDHHGSWCRLSSRRTSHRHRAVRLLNPPAVLMRSVGLKREPSIEKFTLRELRDSILSIRANIPKIQSGQPVIPCSFDEFSSATVAPDHLLCSHFRDLLLIGFLSLATKEKRRKFEKGLLELSRESGFITQNRLFCTEKRRVLLMSLSHVHALTPFASCIYSSMFSLDELQNKHAVIRDTLSSCHHFISIVWQPYVSRLVGECRSMSAAEIEKFRRNAVESKFRIHWKNLLKVCIVSDELEQSMLLNSGQLRPVKEFNFEQRLAFDTIRILSKPNTHRIREFFLQLIFLWPHAVWFGELSLEKVHQRIKRTLQHSNRHNEHSLALQNCRFSDWQGRLHSCFIRHGHELVIDALLASRILGGNNFVNKIREAIPASVLTRIRKLLKPGGIVAEELSLQSQYVFNSHSTGICRRFVFPDRAALPLQSNWASFRDDVKRILQGSGFAFTDLDSVLTSSLRIRCTCGFRNLRIKVGDIRLVRSGHELCAHGKVCDVNEHPVQSSTFHLYRVLAYVKHAANESGFAAIAQRFFCDVDDVDSTGNVRFSSLHLIPVDPDSTIWKSFHSCGRLGCSISNSGKILHKRGSESTDFYELMQWFSGYLPRSG